MATTEDITVRLTQIEKDIEGIMADLVKLQHEGNDTADMIHGNLTDSFDMAIEAIASLRRLGAII